MCKNFVSDLVEKMGGDDVFRARVDVSVRSLQNWKKNNFVPRERRGDVILAAQDLKIIIKGTDFVYEMKEVEK
jgi:hypothetical protein